MDRKKQLKQLYKETPVKGGIYKITNKQNGKLFIGATRNFKTINGVKFSLENKSHINKELMEDWATYGKDAFDFEILETLEKKDTPYFNEKEELANLEEKWLTELQPYDEKGYHSRK